MVPVLLMKMKRNQSGSMAVLAIFLVLALAVLAGAGFFLMQSGGLGTSTGAAESPSAVDAEPAVAVGPEDINDDGMITGVDVQLVNASLGCVSSDACWNEVIGKTLSGDNPIYTSDLDLDGDGNITTSDVAMVSEKME